MIPGDWYCWLLVRTRYALAGGGSKAQTRSPVQALAYARQELVAHLPKAILTSILQVRRATRVGGFARPDGGLTRGGPRCGGCHVCWGAPS